MTKIVISHLPEIDKFYLCAKDPFNAKNQLLVNKRENTDLGIFNDPKDFIEYSNDMDNIDKTIDEYNVNKKRKIQILFDDMIADVLSNTNLIVTVIRQ